jgi:hypothetical protein
MKTSLGNETIHQILRRGSAEQRSRLIKNHSLDSEHLLSLASYSSSRDWRGHAKEIMDSGQHIGSHNLQKQLVRSTRSIAQQVMEHPEAKHNKIHLKSIHDEMVRTYWRAPELLKHWYEN